MSITSISSAIDTLATATATGGSVLSVTNPLAPSITSFSPNNGTSNSFTPSLSTVTSTSLSTYTNTRISSEYTYTYTFTQTWAVSGTSSARYYSIRSGTATVTSSYRPTSTRNIIDESVARQKRESGMMVLIVVFAVLGVGFIAGLFGTWACCRAKRRQTAISRRGLVVRPNIEDIRVMHEIDSAPTTYGGHTGSRGIISQPRDAGPNITLGAAWINISSPTSGGSSDRQDFSAFRSVSAAERMADSWRTNGNGNADARLSRDVEREGDWELTTDEAIRLFVTPFPPGSSSSLSSTMTSGGGTTTSNRAATVTGTGTGTGTRNSTNRRSTSVSGTGTSARLSQVVEEEQADAVATRLSTAPAPAYALNAADRETVLDIGEAPPPPASPPAVHARAGRSSGEYEYETRVEGEMPPGYTVTDRSSAIRRSRVSGSMV